MTSYYERLVNLDEEIKNALGRKNLKADYCDTLINLLQAKKNILKDPKRLKKDRNWDILYSLLYIIMGLTLTIAMFSLSVTASHFQFFGFLSFIPGILTIRLIPDFIKSLNDYDKNWSLWQEICAKETPAKIDSQINSLMQQKNHCPELIIEELVDTEKNQMSIFPNPELIDGQIVLAEIREIYNDALFTINPSEIKTSIVTKQGDAIGLTYDGATEKYVVYQTNSDGSLAWTHEYEDSQEALEWARKFYLGYSASNRESIYELCRARKRYDLNNLGKGEK